MYVRMYITHCNLSDILGSTGEPPNKGHFGTTPFILCKEAVLFGRFKMYWNYKEDVFWAQAVSFVERFIRRCWTVCVRIYGFLCIFAGDDDVIIVQTKRKNTATIGLLVHAAGMYVYMYIRCMCMYMCVCMRMCAYVIVQIFVYM